MDKAYCLNRDEILRKINSRIASIRPPSFIPSVIRPIETYPKWKAHEMLTFILYYAVPTLEGLLPTEFLKNLKKLVISFEQLLCKNISKRNLIIVQKCLEEFLCELEKLYGLDFMLSGVHEMSHLVNETIYFGPLNNINCFPFEELNRIIIKKIHGRDLIGEEFIKTFSIAQALSAYISSLPDENVIGQYIKEDYCFKTSNRKRLNEHQGLKIFSNPVMSSDASVITLWNAYKKFLGETNDFEDKEVLTIKKLSKNGTVYDTFEGIRKRCDSCFISNKNEIGLTSIYILYKGY